MVQVVSTQLTQSLRWRSQIYYILSFKTLFTFTDKIALLSILPGPTKWPRQELKSIECVLISHLPTIYLILGTFSFIIIWFHIVLICYKTSSLHIFFIDSKYPPLNPILYFLHLGGVCSIHR